MIEDIPTLQNMVKKRDEIIKSLQEKLDSLRNQGATGDYEELCIQLKAATGEITRLEGLHQGCREALGQQREGNDKWEVICKDLQEELLKTQKQLDQECDSNVKLEDKLKEASEGITIKAVPDKREEQIKLLEEKLAVCDAWYKELGTKHSDLIADLQERLDKEG